jgi:CcmD family protein
MGYLFGAYLILWGITFAYIFSLNSRQQQLQREVELLQERQEPISAQRPK